MARRMGKTMAEKLRNYEAVPVSGCWLWLGQINPSGYGRVPAPGGSRYLAAHRESYRHYVGEFPEHLQVCHRCDVRSCINPAHLFLGTAKDNAADMIRKGRSLVGERHHWKKLSDSAVIKILQDSRIARDVAADYGVSEGMIRHVKKRRAWGHVEP